MMNVTSKNSKKRTRVSGGEFGFPSSLLRSYAVAGASARKFQFRVFRDFYLCNKKVS